MEKKNNIAKTKQQIAIEYGVCWKTFNKWLKRADIKIERGLITPKDQEMIYGKFGVPISSKKEQ